MQRNLEEVLRRLDQDRQAADERAKRLGYPSREAREEAAKQEWQARMDDYMGSVQEKQTQLEEMFPEAQQWRDPHPWLPCNCAGELLRDYCRRLHSFPVLNLRSIEHHIPAFCPHQLVDYRSMDTSNFEGPFVSQHGPPLEELDIAPDAPSKRLPKSQLKRLWAMSSQECPSELPVWTKNDSILQKIIAVSESESEGCSESPLGTLASMTPTSLRSKCNIEQNPDGDLMMEASSRRQAPLAPPRQPSSSTAQGPQRVYTAKSPPQRRITRDRLCRRRRASNAKQRITKYHRSKPDAQSRENSIDPTPNTRVS